MRRRLGVHLLAAMSAIAFSSVGCEDGEDVEVVIAGANDLGVSEVEIHRGKTDKGEPRIEAIGLDGKGNELGRATLLVTDVLWPPTTQFGEVAPSQGLQPGSVLTLTFGDRSLDFTQADRTRQTLFVADPALRKFESMPAVEAAIEEAVGLTVGWKSAAEVAGESPYGHMWVTNTGAGYCYNQRWPTRDGYLNTCSEMYYDSGGSSGYQWTTGFGNCYVRGEYNYCRYGNGTTGCSSAGTMCAFGPCGGAPGYNMASVQAGGTAFLHWNGSYWINGIDSNGNTSSAYYKDPYEIIQGDTNFAASGMQVNSACTFTGCNSNGTRY